MHRVGSALLTFCFFVCIVNADDGPITGTHMEFKLAASDAGGLPTEQDALAGTTYPLGGIVLLGGEDDEGPTAQFTRVDPLTGETQELPPLLEARSGLCAGTFGGRVYAIGGRNGDKVLDRVDVYDPATRKWSEGPKLKKEVYGAACVSSPRGIWVIGGSNGKKCEKDVWHLVRDKKGEWEWNSLGKLKTARSHHGAVLLHDGRILVVGGRDEAPLASCEFFNGKKSATGPDLPEPSDDLVAGIIYYPDESIVCLRGLKGADVQAPLVLNQKAAQWEPRPGWDALARAGATGVPHCGRLLAAGGTDKEGKRLSSIRSFGWDGEWKETLSPKDTADFKDLRISPDGKQLVWGGSTCQLEVRDATSLELLRSCKFDKLVRSVDWSPDGKQIAVGLSGGRVHLYDAATLKPFVDFESGMAGQFTLRWSPRGDQIAVGGHEDWPVKLFSPTEGSLVRTLKGHTNVVTGLAYSADGKRLLTASKDGSARVWNVDNGETIAKWGDGVSTYWGGDISADGLIGAVGSRDGTLVVFDIESGETIMQAQHSNGAIHVVRLRQDGMFVVATQRGKEGKEPEYMMWAVHTGELVAVLDADGTPYGQFAEFHPTRNALYLEAGYRLSAMEYFPRND